MSIFVIGEHPPQPLRWWNSNKKRINMSPSYQRRGHIWSKPRRALLIDSILNGYDVPKFYLSDFTLANTALNDQEKAYAVIDGKQRLNAIFEFFDDQLVLDGECSLKQSGEPLAGLNYSKLKQRHPEAAVRFEEFVPMVMSVASDDKERIEELFVRLNLAAPPNGAEVRNAMPGIVPGLTRQLADHQFFTKAVRFSVSRYEDRNTATKLLLIEHNGGLMSTKKADLDRFARLAAKPNTDAATFIAEEKRAEDVLDRMAEVFQTRDVLLSSSGRVPLYYWLVREVDQSSLPDLRAFLIGFEEERKQNRALAERDRQSADSELLLFDTSARSPNDQKRLESMYAILAKRMDDKKRQPLRVSARSGEAIS